MNLDVVFFAVGTFGLEWHSTNRGEEKLCLLLLSRYEGRACAEYGFIPSPLSPQSLICGGDTITGLCILLSH